MPSIYLADRSVIMPGSVPFLIPAGSYEGSFLEVSGPLTGSDNENVVNAPDNYHPATNPDQKDTDGSGLIDYGDSVGYKRSELFSPIDKDSVTSTISL